MAAPARPPRSRNLDTLSTLSRLGLDPTRNDGLLDDFLARYTNPKVRQEIERRLAHMFRHAGTTDPSQITVPQIARFVTSPAGPSQRTANQYPANNTVHKRMGTVRMFLTFCARRGIPVCDFDDALRTIGKSHPVTYGKQQDKYPARFLTREEAFDAW